MTNQLFKRNIVKQITPYLGDDSIIVLHGARQVGKTHIMYYLQNQLEEQGQNCAYLDLEDGRILETLDLGIDSFINYLQSLGKLKVKSSTLIPDTKLDSKSKTYIFIDEIQYLSNPSSFLKQIADHHKYIQLIVSGSSSFEIKSKFKDSLVGRTVNFEIFNLSFSEYLVFKGLEYDLNVELLPTNPVLFQLQKEYNEYLLYGGYPQIVLEPEISKKEKKLQQIIQTYVQKDIKDLANITDTKKFNQLLKILASQNGQMLNISDLSNLSGIAKNTIDKYLFILENTYILKLLPPYSQNGKLEITKTPKIFFYDTGLVQMLNNKELTQSRKGNLFENSVFVELVKNYGHRDLYYWRTKSQSEIDFVLSYKNQLVPIEVKYSFGQFRSTVIKGFCEKNNIQDYSVVGLEGQRGQSCIYPWMVSGLVK
jgi:uncharacterized protein